jgi:multiple sugar transport system substrate-binding protein
MTWRHRRAIDPLTGTLPSFRARESGIEVSWDARPLSGFEFTPVTELAQSYDLIILDHPFAGDIAASGCLLPLDDLAGELPAGAFVGPSLESYTYGGHLWAIPVDAATQVAVYRPDLLSRLGSTVPRVWAEVFSLGERAGREGWRLAIGLKGVHALMTLFTLCANQGRPCGGSPGQPFADLDAARRALAALRKLLTYCPPQALDWSSIDLHEAMVERDDLVYCPAVYCYATYAETDRKRALVFADMPGLQTTSPAGSTLGGTGVGISASTVHPNAAMAYVRFLMRDETQRAFARHHGQPARVEAWDDPDLDGRFGQCFGNTRRTIEQAWTRPRYAGYLRFQADASEVLELHLRGKVPEAQLMGQLAMLHARGGG